MLIIVIHGTGMHLTGRSLTEGMMRMLRVLSLSLFGGVLLACDSDPASLFTQGVIESVTPGNGGTFDVLVDEGNGSSCNKSDVTVNPATRLEFVGGGAADQSALTVGRYVSVFVGPGVGVLDRCPGEVVAARLVLN